MQTRLQVEHPITEMITGLDLVSWQLQVNSIILQKTLLTSLGGRWKTSTAQSEPDQTNGTLFRSTNLCRKPEKVSLRNICRPISPSISNFLPETGKLAYVRPPPTSDSVRLETGFISGDEVQVRFFRLLRTRLKDGQVHYDPMIAKLVVHAEDRPAALRKLRHSLEQYHIAGLHTNIPFLLSLASHPSFEAGEVETGFIDVCRSSRSRARTNLQVRNITRSSSSLFKRPLLLS
jgi:3-methylcrotonyl-CoA carboxylase alpha subunit